MIDEQDDYEYWKDGVWHDATAHNLNDLMSELRFEMPNPDGNGLFYDHLVICWCFEDEDEYYFHEGYLEETGKITGFGRLLDERDKGTTAIHCQHADNDGNKLEVPIEHRVHIWGYFLIPEIPNDFFYYFNEDGNKQWT